MIWCTSSANEHYVNKCRQIYIIIFFSIAGTRQPSIGGTRQAKTN